MRISETDRLLKRSVMERSVKVEIKTVLWEIRRSLETLKISGLTEFVEGKTYVEAGFQRGL